MTLTSLGNNLFVRFVSDGSVRGKGFTATYLSKNSGSEFTPTANPMKVLQACIYKSENTGLFLESLVAKVIVIFHMLMLFNPF